MDRRIVGQFGMKRRCENMLLLNEGGPPVMLRQNGDVGADTFDQGATNEHHFERFFFQLAGAEEYVAGKLAAVTIPQDGYIEKAEGGLRGIVDASGKQNRAGTSAKDSATSLSKNLDSVEESFFLEELQLRGTLTAGENDAAAANQISDFAHLDGVCAEGFQDGGVGFEITLNSENPDFHRCAKPPFGE